MDVQVRLFASLRERAGTALLELELADGATVADALAQLAWLTGGMRAALAVNREYASESTPLAPGDELALIPPVSGGSESHQSGGPAGPPHVRVTREPLAAARLEALVRDPRAGAVVTFQGVTREVPALQYEAYVEMAVAEIEAIAAAASVRHGLCAVAVEHRIGEVALSEPSVVIAVSAPHRGEAFAGAREIIDELKARAPIWKREAGQWVAGHAVSAPRGPVG
jgi:molybdopterin synthase catalytic subunit